jgi:glycosyltransferase involved in cell wall biosynthesis
MRILIVTGIFPPDHGGPASYVPAIATELARRHEVLGVVTLSDEPIGADNGYPFPVFRLPRHQNRLLRRLRTIQTIARLAVKADVVYLNGLVLEGILAVKALGRRPTVIKVVGDLVWESARNAGVTSASLDEFQAVALPAKQLLLRRLQGWYTNRADAVITPSLYLARIVEGWGVEPRKIEVVYNAIYLPPPPPAIAEPTFDCVTVARLVPWKGMADLIEASIAHGWRLKIVGDGPLRAELEAQARSAPPGQIVFTGHVDKAKVSDEIASAKVFILNSTYEGLPHIVLEAKATGVPVIATAAGGTPETITHGIDGLLIPPASPADLVSAIASLLNDDAARRRIGLAGQQQVQVAFSYGALVARTEQVLAAVAHGSTSA